MKQRILRFLKVNWLHIVAGLAIFVSCVAFVLIVQSSTSEKAAWMLVPLTGIYCVLTLYVAAGTMTAASAAGQSATVMAETLRQMTVQFWLSNQPWVVWPEHPRCVRLTHGRLQFRVRNLSAHRVGGLMLYVWSTELQRDGSYRPIASSELQAGPTELFADADLQLVCSRSDRLESERTTAIGLAEAWMQANHAELREGDVLCDITYWTLLGALGPFYIVFTPYDRLASVGTLDALPDRIE